MQGKRVIIVGGGFGGLNAAQQLKKADVNVLLIDRSNHHLFQPLLYQVATAALSPSDIAVPFREILLKQKNADVIMGNVSNIDLKNKAVHLCDGDIYPYDYLILAPGARHSYFGNNAWEDFAPGLKSLNDAIRIREEVLMAFEHAERATDPKEIEKYLRFVVIGGGPTGVEMAGAIAEISRKTLFSNFRHIKPELSEVYLIEGAPRILPVYTQKLSDKAQKDLELMGVHVLTNAKVTKVEHEAVYIGDRCLEAANIIWAAGNEASPLLKTLGVPLDRAGRVLVKSDLTVPDHPEVFVIGDAAAMMDEAGRPIPGIAPAAIQSGQYVAKMIRKDIPVEKRPPFKYWDKGTMATIGKAKAVAMVGKLQFSGVIAWLLWCFIHVIFLVSFRSKMIVLTQWFFWWLSGRHYVRLIKTPYPSEEKN